MARQQWVEPARTYYISPDGNDTWSGRKPSPNAKGTDGPWQTLQHAKLILRELKRRGQLAAPVTVQLRGGRYELEEPLVFGPDDSAPVTFAAYKKETPVVSGGVRIEGWKGATVNGKRAWVVELPEVAAGTWAFRSLYVNGEHRPRPCLPKQGMYRVAEVPDMPLPNGWRNEHYDRFRLEPGQMQDYRNVTDIEIVLFHFWIDERFPVAAFDPETEMITASRASRAPLTEAFGETLAPCYLENVFEGLTEPGEWYLDRAEGKLYYIPRKGETMKDTVVVAPKAKQLLRLQGDPADEKHVEWLRFEGITFGETDWIQPGPDVETLMAPAFVSPGRWQHRRYRKTMASSCQGAADVPGVLQFVGARYCAVEHCRIANVGWYGLNLADGCRSCRIVGNEIFDMGAGGIIVDGATYDEPRELATGEHRITDNHIHSGGHVFHSGIGVLAMNSFGNTIAHNHIHDLYYSGVSCGWVWGYAASISRDNLIYKNHIHDLGKGKLSDMGGIYTLGVQPGTVLRENLIHGVEKLNYGAWCIYPDEGSSHILIEKNICYDTNGEIFHQHYGRENLVRNNIFAFGGDSVLAHGRITPEHKGMSFERNIFITDGKPIFKGGYNCALAERNQRSDLNVLWDVHDAPLSFVDHAGTLDLAGWQALGHDRHSMVADPQVRDLDARDFRLGKDGPAAEIGFEPIDLSDVGPRPPAKRD